MVMLVLAVAPPEIASRVAFEGAIHGSVTMRRVQTATDGEVEHRGERRDNGDEGAHDTKCIDGRTMPPDISF